MLKSATVGAKQKRNGYNASYQYLGFLIALCVGNKAETAYAIKHINVEAIA